MIEHILVVDPDAAFATLLKEGLEQTGQYRVVTTSNGQAALDALRVARFEMIILDLGLADPSAAQVAQSVRTQLPQLPLMVIPLDGDTVPPEIGTLGIQGVLTKPFFLPDLPSLVERAMKTQPITAAAPAPEVKESSAMPSAPPAPPALPPRLEWTRNEKELTARLNELARELNAEAVLLTWGNEVVAHAGRFTRQQSEQLAHVIIESWHASAKVAQLLGRERVRFEQSMHEGGDYLLYSLSPAEEVVVTVALNSSTPLGMIRYHTKRTAETIAKMIAA